MTYRQGRHDLDFSKVTCATTSGSQPHINPSPDALEIDVSRDIKLRDLANGGPIETAEARSEASKMTAGAIEMFGGNAPTAVAYCGLDAWLEGDEKQVALWGEVFNRLKT
ncbi:hypothetical protein [Shinella zoogloeoides]|jgi:hypothetical protein|uniref:hypothetical protein n=1 Tax=Shinella zoogloeoides TaxID=352475 RepID=UPI00273FE754|nr:hypothetical protein [Shinella zoogloeoides]WLR95732.1 hypothetical protein Q9316_23675 [Shinella zoogloeoides]